MKENIYIGLIFAIFSNCAQAQTLPSFVLACSYGGGPSLYRLASDGKDIYFASILNDANMNNARKSSSIIVSQREIKWNMKSGEELHGPGESGILYRDSLRFEKDHLVFSCDRIEDKHLFNDLKSRFNATRANALAKKQKYDQRPNKL